MSIYLADVHSPFGLPALTDEWLRSLEQYDPDLRIFPSQKMPVYRVARVARNSGGLSSVFFGNIQGLNPDTAICIKHKLVAVPVTIHKAGAESSPDVILKKLQDRDVWRHGGWEKVADILDAQDVVREKKVEQQRRDDLRVRARAMRSGFLYRTGARVSLVSPLRNVAAAATSSPSAQGSALPEAGG